MMDDLAVARDLAQAISYISTTLDPDDPASGTLSRLAWLVIDRIDAAEAKCAELRALRVVGGGT